MSALKQEQAAQFTERDVVLGVAMACGVTVKEAAVALGISERWAAEHRARWGSTLDRVAALVASIVKTKREIRAIAKDQVKGEMEKLLGGAVQAIQRGLEAGDLTVAMQASDRVLKLLGFMNTKVEVSGQIGHAHYALPPELAAAFALDAAEDYEFHTRARRLTAGVIDITPESDDRDN